MKKFSITFSDIDYFVDASDTIMYKVHLDERVS